jgi:hydrogenase-1 operon protein HyaF
LSRLDTIPIRIEGVPIPGGPATTDGAALSGGLGAGISAILAELATLLEQLAEQQIPAAIDLRSLPMSPKDRDELQQLLGEGEVQATIHADGLSVLRETRFAGVWWVMHRNTEGELIAELLEVAYVPQMLASASDEVTAAARELRERIGAVARAGTRKHH